MFEIEWIPEGGGEKGLRMAMRAGARPDVEAFAARADSPATFRLRSAGGAEVVTGRAAVSAWRDGAALPDLEGEWTEPAAPRGDMAHALDMLEALLAWSRSRGLVDAGRSRSISRAVQMELAGATRRGPG